MANRADVGNGEDCSSWSALCEVGSLLSKRNKAVSKETFLIIVASISAICGLIHGYLVTFLGLEFYDESTSFSANVDDNMFADSSVIASPIITTVTILQSSTTSDYSQSSSVIYTYYLGLILGSLLSYPLSDMLGRRNTVIFSSFCGVLCIIWASFSVTFNDLCSALFFVSWALGVHLSIMPCFVSEVALPSNRGQLVGFLTLGLTIGSTFAVIAYVILRHQAFGWRVGISLASVPFCIHAVLMHHVPESFRWQLAHRTPSGLSGICDVRDWFNNSWDTECLQSMRHFRKTSEVSKEFNEIYKALSTDAKQGDGWTDILRNDSIRYRLLLCCLIEFSQQLVGIQVLSSVGAAVLASIGVHSAALGLFLSYCSAILGAFFGLSKIEVWGRRFLMLASCCCVALSWFGALLCAMVGGLEEGRSELHFNSYLLRFVFGSFLCLFAFSYAFGIGIISWVVPAELFPLRARAKASSLTTSLRFAAALLSSSLIRTYINTGYSAKNCFALFGGSSVLLGLCMTVALPETKGLTMLDDTECLFDVSGSCCCIMDSKFSILGFRTARNATHLDAAYDGTVAAYQSETSESPLFDPALLHKYSSDMRATNFVFIEEGDHSIEVSSAITNSIDRKQFSNKKKSGSKSSLLQGSQGVAIASKGVSNTISSTFLMPKESAPS